MDWNAVEWFYFSIFSLLINLIYLPNLSVFYYISFHYIKPLLEEFLFCIFLCLPDHIKSKINICVCVHVQYI